MSVAVSERVVVTCHTLMTDNRTDSNHQGHTAPEVPKGVGGNGGGRAEVTVFELHIVWMKGNDLGRSGNMKQNKLGK